MLGNHCDYIHLTCTFAQHMLCHIIFKTKQPKSTCFDTFDERDKPLDARLHQLCINAFNSLTVVCDFSFPNFHCNKNRIVEINVCIVQPYTHTNTIKPSANKLYDHGYIRIIGIGLHGMLRRELFGRKI